MCERQKNKRNELTEDDPIVFIPDEDRRAIEHVIRKMDQARLDLHEIRKGGRSPDSEERIQKG